MGALAMGGLWFNGMTKTPWKPALTSSGSSAGSASATAAGLVGFSIGTETLGSIISPSIRCGTVGLRPTYGRVSRHGAMALSWTMDKIGPICRSVEDTALVLQAIYGPDGRDSTVLDAPFLWDPARKLSSLKIGIVQGDFDTLKEDEKALYQQAIADLKKAGVKMTPVVIPEFDVNPLRIILNAEAAAAFDDITRDGAVDKLRDQSAGAWPNSFRTSRMIPAVEYIRASRARTLLMQTMDKFFADWDVIVSPPYAGNLLTTTNLTGHPQVVVPCGFVDGLPRGLVFTGRVCEEGSPLRVALAFEKATKWHLQKPTLT
jgi:Asp-tRNA(Asn)/Glu-tRNA(Gln) amidotransferase A subunit family amidase